MPDLAHARRYTGRVGGVNSVTSDTESVATSATLHDLEPEDVMELMSAADQYQLPHLKSLCGSLLQGVLDAENLMAIFAFAKLHEAKNLSLACIDYMMQPETGEAVSAAALVHKDKGWVLQHFGPLIKEVLARAWMPSGMRARYDRETDQAAGARLGSRHSRGSQLSTSAQMPVVGGGNIGAQLGGAHHRRATSSSSSVSAHRRRRRRHSGRVRRSPR